QSWGRGFHLAVMLGCGEKSGQPRWGGLSTEGISATAHFRCSACWVAVVILRAGRGGAEARSVGEPGAGGDSLERRFALPSRVMWQLQNRMLLSHPIALKEIA